MNTQAIKAAEDYLRNKLGDRSGCDILDTVDEGTQNEIIMELADAFQNYAEKWLTSGAHRNYGKHRQK